MTTLEDALAGYFAEQRALDAAWRWVRRSTAPTIKLSEIVARAERHYPGIDPEMVREHVERKMSRSRYRPRR